MTVKAVVFDIGNVLIRWEPEVFYDARLGAARRHEMFAAAELHAMNLEIDRGADFRQTVYARAEAHPEFASEIRHWHDSLSDFVTGTIERSVSILLTLRARGVPVFALSNFGREPFAIARAQFPFLCAFDRAFLSGDLGLVKPDPAIYAVLEREIGLSGPDIFFTDDRVDNVEAALDRGWQAHRFADPGNLAGALREAGMAPEAAA